MCSVRPAGRLLALFVAIAMGAAVLVGGATASAASRVAQPLSAARGVEDPGLRTANSETFVSPDGVRTARFFSSPHFFREGQSWKPIDRTLARRSGGRSLGNGENAYSLDIPTSLAGRSVGIAQGSSKIDFTLRGATGDAAIDGDTATFADALPGTDASYSDDGSGLKESLTLKDSGAPSVFRFDVRADGLTPQVTKSGAVYFKGPGADFLMPAPVVFPKGQPRQGDSSAVTSTFTRETDGWLLTIAIDPVWLRAHLADGPVVVDPSFHQITTHTDCFLESSPADSYSFCGMTGSGAVGWFGSQELRLALQFGVAGSIPVGSKVLNATLYLRSGDPLPSDQNIEIDPMSVYWDTTATWNRDTSYDLGDSWEGGTWGPGPVMESTDAAAPPDADGGRAVQWHPTSIVQQWVNGTIADDGFLIRYPSGSTGSHMWISGSGDAPPSLDITYEPPTGRMPGYSFDDHRVDDRATVSVNRATGNALLESKDLNEVGIGQNLILDRDYNSLNSTVVGAFGVGTTASLGQDERLITVGRSVYFRGPSGAPIWFTDTTRYGSPGATWVAPSDFDGTLVRNTTTGTWTLTYGDGTTWFYSSAGYLTDVVDKDGNQISLAYDSSTPKRMTGIEDTQGRTFTVAYNTAGYVSSITEDATSRQWQYAYDSGGRLISAADPVHPSSPTTYGWDTGTNRVTSVTSPEGRTVSLTYSSPGRVATLSQKKTSTSSADTWTYSYGSDWTNALSVHVQDPRGNTTQYEGDYNGGRVIRTVSASGKPYLTTDTYNTAGQKTTEYLYDSSGSYLTGASWSYSSTDPFVLTGSTGFDGGHTTYAYGDSSHPTDPTSITQPDGSVETLNWENSAETSTNPDVTSGRLQSVTDGNGKLIYVLSYNGAGQMTQVTDRFGTSLATYTYGDSQHNLTKIDRPGGLGSDTMSYDSDGRPATEHLGVTSTDTGKAQTFTYDGDDRTTRVQYGDGSHDITYAYDADGNQTSRVTADGTTSWTYDGEQHVTGQTLPNSHTTSYTYDASGNLASLTDAGGTVTYGYDADNRPTSVTEPAISGNPTAQQTTMTYNSLGQQSSITTPNGATSSSPSGVNESETYDAAGHLTGIDVTNPSGTHLLTHTYNYLAPNGSGGTYPSGLLQTDTDGSGNVTSYSYDQNSRLKEALTVTSSSSQVSDYKYTYDERGNVVTSSVAGAGSPTGTSYTSNIADQLTSVTTGSTTTDFTYDDEGDLLHTSLGGTIDRAFAYNDRLQTTSITPSGGTATSMGYANKDQNQPSSSGSTTFDNDALGIASSTSSAGSTYYTRGPDGALIGERTPSGRYYYVLGRNNTVLGLTDSSRALANSYTYTPYGGTASSSGSAPNIFGFDGGQNSPGGLIRFGTRYYDPITERWTQPDPVNQATDLTQANRYAYAGGDPVNQVDPGGTCLLKTATYYPKLGLWLNIRYRENHHKPIGSICGDKSRPNYCIVASDAFTVLGLFVPEGWAARITAAAVGLTFNHLC